MDVQLSGVVQSDAELRVVLASGVLKGARTLSAWNSALTDAGAEAIAEAADAAELDYVDLSWNHIGHAGAGALAESLQLARLTRLRLYHNQAGVEGATRVAAHGERLALLNLCGNQLGDDGVRALAGGTLDDLRELALGWNDLGAGAAHALASGPWHSLVRLNVRENRLDGDAVAALLSGELPALRWLGVDENPLGAGGLAAMVHAPGFATLEWLNLGGTGLDDASLVHLTHGCALRELRIHDNELSHAAVNALRTRLPACEVIA